MFEILQTGEFQQMKISRMDLDGNRVVRTAICEGCNISETNSKVNGLVTSLFEEYQIQNKQV